MGVNLAVSHQVRNRGWGCSRVCAEEGIWTCQVWGKWRMEETA